MAYRYGDRNQMQLLPPSIEEYVALDDSVRVYEAFVESLDLDELGIIWDEHKVGNSEYNPIRLWRIGIWLLLWSPQFSEIGNGDLS
jgi:transposase